MLSCRNAFRFHRLVSMTSVDEKIDYLQSLWDRIAATPETIPVPDWHPEIIHERVKDLDANPDVGDDWDVVRERLRKKFDDRR